MPEPRYMGRTPEEIARFKVLDNASRIDRYRKIARSGVRVVGAGAMIFLSAVAVGALTGEAPREPGCIVVTNEEDFMPTLADKTGASMAEVKRLNPGVSNRPPAGTELKLPECGDLGETHQVKEITNNE